MTTKRWRQIGQRWSTRQRRPAGAWRHELLLWLITATVGVAGEIGFYTLIKVGARVPFVGPLLFGFAWRVDSRLPLDGVWHVPIRMLFGQCSLWMAPVYATCTCAMIRPLARLLRRWPFWARAAVYGVVIALAEGAWGLLYQALLGFSVWTYRDAGAVLGGATSLRIVPLWMLVGLFAERLVIELSHPVWRNAVALRWRREEQGE